MTSRTREVVIAKAISPDLAFRHSAAAFFDDIERMPEKTVVVDFRGVDSISRAFAHEYQERKRGSAKRIEERNVPEDVLRMMAVVADPAPKKKTYVEVNTESVDTG